MPKQGKRNAPDFDFLREALMMLATPEMASQVGRVFHLYTYIRKTSEFSAAIHGDIVYVMLPFAPRIVIGAVRSVEQFNELHERWHARVDPLTDEDADPMEIARFVTGIITRGEL